MVSMGKADIEKLLSDISPDSPCGEDVSYDPAFLALERLLSPPSSGLIQEEAPEEPDWEAIYTQSHALLLRSKNLRAALYLTLALLKLEGFSGLSEGLSILRDYIERHWNDVYPRLDPEDNFDCLERQNILSSLSLEGVMQDTMKFIQRILESPLCESRQLGRFSFRDIQIAKGTLVIPGQSEDNKPRLSVIEAAFQDVGSETLTQTRHIIETCVSHIHAISGAFESQSVQGQPLSFDRLLTVLGGILKYLQGSTAAEPSAGAEVVADGSADESPSRVTGVAAGEIRSPQDAVEAIDKICRYFERHEPSSPVPLLLQRAKRLVSANFMDVIRDVCPDALGQIELVSGVSVQKTSDQE